VFQISKDGGNCYAAVRAAAPGAASAGSALPKAHLLSVAILYGCGGRLPAAPGGFGQGDVGSISAGFLDPSSNVVGEPSSGITISFDSPNSGAGRSFVPPPPVSSPSRCLYYTLTPAHQQQPSHPRAGRERGAAQVVRMLCGGSGDPGRGVELGAGGTGKYQVPLAHHARRRRPVGR
jgi:hypothetical protein